MSGRVKTRHRYILLGALLISAMTLGLLPAVGDRRVEPTQVSGQPSISPDLGSEQSSVQGRESETGRAQVGQELPAAPQPVPTQITVPNRNVQSNPVLAVLPPEVPPGFVPDPGPPRPGVTKVGNCPVTTEAVEIFPAEAVAKGQRVFDTPAVRLFLRADGTCVHLLKSPDLPVPESAPDTIVSPVP